MTGREGLVIPRVEEQHAVFSAAYRLRGRDLGDGGVWVESVVPGAVEAHLLREVGRGVGQALGDRGDELVLAHRGQCVVHRALLTQG